MPARMIDFNSMWGSDKLAACALWARREYSWLYGLADAHGSFELTNIRVIHGQVAPIREDLSIEQLAQIFEEYHNRGLLFVWKRDGKRFGHWTGSDRPGRLPPKSIRNRYSRSTPLVPQNELEDYLAKFSNNDTQSVLTGSRQGLARTGEGLEGDRIENPSTSASGSLEPQQDAFDRFWGLYPKKVDKQRAWIAWRKVKPPEYEAVFASVEVYKRTEQWRKRGGQFVPYPATFINTRRWEDELTAAPDSHLPQSVPNPDEVVRIAVPL